MNNSNQQPSGGFIYFPTNVSKTETSEYMAFTESPARGSLKQDFSPRNYSSPHYQPRNPNYRGRFKDNNRKSWQNNSYSPYKGNYSYTNRSYKSNGDKSFNKNSYLHPSFTEDPWAQLESKSKRNLSQQSENAGEDSSIETTT